MESFECSPEDIKSGFSRLESLFVPRVISDLPSDQESRYTEYTNNISFLQGEDVILDAVSSQSTSETDLLGVSLELDSAPYLDDCECFAAIRPVNLISKFALQEVKVIDNAFRETEERATSLLSEFECRLWDDEIAFHDPTVKPLKGKLR